MAAKLRHYPVRILARQSSSITLAMLFTMLLAIGVVALLYFMHIAKSTNQNNEVAAIISTDMDGLMDNYHTGGIAQLEAVLMWRLKHPGNGKIYALQSPGGEVVSGNFAYVPEVTAAHENRLSDETGVFEITRENDPSVSGLPSGKPYKILALIRDIGEGYRLMVARNVPETQTNAHMIDLLGWGAIGMLVFLAIAGFFIGDRVVYRINLIADTASHIMATGDLSRRIPVPGQWDDLSMLAKILNELIERVESLMLGVRQVSDNIAHDLRTPLTRLKNQLEMLHDQSEDEQLGISEKTEKLIAEADHLLATFAALLRIGNIESGKWRGDMELLSCHTLVQDVLEFYEPLASERQQTMHVTLGEGMLSGDKHLLFQAIANILDNAIKYEPLGGDIWVELVRTTEQKLVLSITNSGSYVEEAQLETIFGRFHRTDKARTSQAGNGLGLSLVQAIVKAHKGSIVAHNAPSGFRMVMTFPEVSA